MQIVRCRIGPLCYLSSNVPLVGKQKLKNCPELGPLTSTFMLSLANVKSCVILCRYMFGPVQFQWITSQALIGLLQFFAGQLQLSAVHL